MIFFPFENAILKTNKKNIKMNQEFVEFFSIPTLSIIVSSIAYKYNYLREDF
jgi:hypothetical protein